MFKKFVLCLALLLPTAALAETITLDVSGMTCGACSKAIKEAFEDLPGVASAQADHKAQKVVIVTKDKETVTDAQIKKIVIDEGYSVDKILRS